jgi:hypothetical protein
MAAMNIEIGIQNIANQVAILSVLGQLIKTVTADHSPEYIAIYYMPVLQRITDELNANTAFLKRADAQIKELSNRGPGGQDTRSN